MTSTYFLFSVDLEDIRARIPSGHLRPNRVPQTTELFLAFLRRQRARCTFFVVGELADAESELVARIADEGHEIGCHTHTHTPLDRLQPDGLRRELEQCLRSLSRLGIDRVTGFRSPSGSLIASTAWAYPILKEFGFTYSSSVIPARSPIYGWPGFGSDMKEIDGITEIPISITELPGLKVPHSSGVYFRALPLWFVAWACSRTLKQKGFVTSYFHPYDVDAEEERTDIPELKGNRLHNWLFYYNRGDVFRRLEKMMTLGGQICTYQEFLDGIRGRQSQATSGASSPL